MRSLIEQNASRPAMVEPLERRALLSAVLLSSGSFGFVDGVRTPASVMDADGTKGTFTLKGPGSGSIAINGDDINIALTGTTAKTVVTLKSTGGDRVFALHDFTASASLGSIAASKTSLSGHLSIDGSIGSIALLSIADGTITAKSVRAIQIGQSATDWQLNVRTAGAINVKGEIASSQLNFLPIELSALKSLRVGGAIRDTRIHAMGDIGSVRALNLNNTSIMAGVAFYKAEDGSYQQRLPRPNEKNGSDDFTGYYTIQSVIAKGNRNTFSFSDSRIAASTVESVKLGTTWSIDGHETGIVANYLGKVIQTRPAGVPALTNVKQFSRPATHTTTTDTSTGTVTDTTSASLVAEFGPSFSASWKTFTHTFINAEQAPQLLPPSTATNRVIVGSVTGYPGATVLMLEEDGTFAFVDESGKILQSDPTLPGLVSAVAGTPGASMKRLSDGTFFSSSVSPRVSLSLPSGGVFETLPTGVSSVQLNNSRLKQTIRWTADHLIATIGAGDNVVKVYPANSSQFAKKLLDDDGIVYETPAVLAVNTIGGESELLGAYTSSGKPAWPNWFHDILNAPNLSALYKLGVEIPTDEQVVTALKVGGYEELEQMPTMVGPEGLVVGERFDVVHGIKPITLLDSGLTSEGVDIVAAMFGSELTGVFRGYESVTDADGSIRIIATADGGTASLSRVNALTLDTKGNLYRTPDADSFKTRLAQVRSETEKDAYSVWKNGG